MIDLVMTINSVQKSSKSELSSTTFGHFSEKVRWGQARWGQRFFEKIAKKYQWNLDSFQTHQQVTQKLQPKYELHRFAVHLVLKL